jgi:outer membrane protein
MDLRMGLRPLLACTALFALTQVASAQIKVAVVDMQAAVFGTAEIKKADAELSANQKPKVEQAQKLQSDLQAIAQQLQAGNGKLPPQQEADLNAQGQKKQRDLQYLNDDLQAEATAARQEIIPKCAQKMKEVVKKMAAEKGLDLVVDAASSVFYKPAMDLTAEAIVAYDKEYPATSAKK